MFSLMARVVSHPILTHLPMLVGVWASTDTSSGTDISVNGGLITQAIQFGFLGAVFLDIVWTHKFLMPTWAHRRELEAVVAGYEAQLRLKDDQIRTLREDNEVVKEANLALQSLVQEKMIPALVQSTEVGRTVVQELARRNDRRDGS